MEVVRANAKIHILKQFTTQPADYDELMGCTC